MVNVFLWDEHGVSVSCSRVDERMQSAEPSESEKGVLRGDKALAMP